MKKRQSFHTAHVLPLDTSGGEDSAPEVALPQQAEAGDFGVDFDKRPKSGALMAGICFFAEDDVPVAGAPKLQSPKISLHKQA